MQALPRQQQPYPAHGRAAKSSQALCQHPNRWGALQDCSMTSPDTTAWLLLLLGCSQAPLLQGRLEPCRGLCNCWVAAMRGEGGHRHLEILGFLSQGQGLLKRLGICCCWMSCRAVPVATRKVMESQVSLGREGDSDTDIQTLLTAASP